MKPNSMLFLKLIIVIILYIVSISNSWSSNIYTSVDILLPTFLYKESSSVN